MTPTPFKVIPRDAIDAEHRAAGLAPPETVAERVRRLQAEARQLAHDHARALAQAMMNTAAMATEIAEGGDAYPAGVRDVARRYAEDVEARVNTLEAITARAR